MIGLSALEVDEGAAILVLLTFAVIMIEWVVAIVLCAEFDANKWGI
jgi:hypothetical protein